MAIAITPFRGFCNFRPLEQIQAFLRDVPELRSLIDPDDALQAKLDDASKLASSKPEDVESNKEMLREIFSKLMKADPDTVAPKAESMVKRFESESELESECKSTSGSTNGVKVDADLAGLVCKIYSQFPGDVGVFCAFLLNVVDLEPGQAIFLRANEPHAYLQGNIMECMAASDNVVRAGLTPKARDVEVLVDMLTYNYGPSDRQLMRPRPFVPLPTSKSAPAYPKEAKEEQQLAKDAAAKSELPTLLYDPPIEEFSVLLTRLSKRSESNEEETQRPLQGPSILITTSGRGQLEYIPAQEPEQGQEREPTPAETPKENGHVAPSPSPSPSRKFELAKAGQVFFVGAGTTVTLRVAEDAAEDEELVVFRAFVEIDEK